MKPLNNCYIVKNKTQKITKIIFARNKRAFFHYLVNRLDVNDELEITTGLYEEAPQLSASRLLK